MKILEIPAAEAYYADGRVGTGIGALTLRFPVLHIAASQRKGCERAGNGGAFGRGQVTHLRGPNRLQRLVQELVGKYGRSSCDNHADSAEHGGEARKALCVELWAFCWEFRRHQFGGRVLGGGCQQRLLRALSIQATLTADPCFFIYCPPMGEV